MARSSSVHKSCVSASNAFSAKPSAASSAISAIRSLVTPVFGLRTRPGLDHYPMDIADHIDYLRREAGVESCNVTRCCNNVCPEGIQVTENALFQQRSVLFDRYSDPLRMLWRNHHGPDENA